MVISEASSFAIFVRGLQRLMGIVFLLLYLGRLAAARVHGFNDEALHELIIIGSHVSTRATSTLTKWQHVLFFLLNLVYDAPLQAVDESTWQVLGEVFLREHKSDLTVLHLYLSRIVVDDRWLS